MKLMWQWYVWKPLKQDNKWMFNIFFIGDTIACKVYIVKYVVFLT